MLPSHTNFGKDAFDAGASEDVEWGDLLNKNSNLRDGEGRAGGGSPLSIEDCAVRRNDCVSGGLADATDAQLRDQGKTAVIIILMLSRLHSAIAAACPILETLVSGAKMALAAEACVGHAPLYSLSTQVGPASARCCERQTAQAAAVCLGDTRVTPTALPVRR